jgi:hypothetical protein
MRKAFKIILFSCLIILTGLIYLFFNYTSGEYYRIYSPDKQYSVYASKNFYENFLPAMPGQSGDASGKVFLYDEIEKKVINSGNIPMISLVGDIMWTETEAYFASDFYPSPTNAWKLPRKLIQRPDTELADGTVITFSPLGYKVDESKYEMINGCKKVTSYQSFNAYGETMLEWWKDYSKAKTESCDFNSYIIHEKQYMQNKLVAETFKHSGCDDCEAYPCGVWRNYDASGKLIDSVIYKPCNINFRPEQK